MCAAPAARADGGHGHARGASPVPPLRYTPPEPGSYELPEIQRVSPHRLLDHTGGEAELPGLARGDVALVSFVYLSCPAVCPATNAVMQLVDRAAAEEPRLKDRLRLVTVSFDPERDRPEHMARLRTSLAPKLDWRFLTASDAAAIGPVLADFGQDAQAPAALESGGQIEHVLKVFLLDGESRVRNIYSSDFLQPRLLLNDALTVMSEAGAEAP